MKAGFVIAVLAVVAYTVLVYFDAVAEQQVYAFCELNSSGNPVSEMKARAEEQGFTQAQIDFQTIELTVDNPLALINQYICEVKLENNRIVSQALLKRSKLF